MCHRCVTESVARRMPNRRAFLSAEPGAILIVGAPKQRGGTGGPSRLFALV